MRHRVTVAVLAGLLFMTAILHSQQNATIQGRLIRLGTTEPVAKASLELRDADAAASVVWTTTSDSEGKFSFRDVPAGRYRLTAIRTGFVTISYGQRSSQGPPETITIVAGQTLPAIQIMMTPAGVISGRIYDKAGQPFANVSVSASRISFQGGNKSLQPARSALTNDLGEYRLFGLAPGIYYVTATQQLGPYPRFVYGGAQPAETFARLRTEQEPTAANAPNAVSVTYPDKTDPFAGVPFDVRPGAEIGNVNFIVGEMQHTTRVQGTFVPPEPGQAIQLITANLILLTGGQNRVMGTPPGGFITNPTFNFGFMPPGPYMLSGYGDEMAGLLFFEVKDEESVDLSLKLQKGFPVPGRITVEGGAFANASVPAFQVELRLDIPIATPGGSTTATPSPDGSFRLEKVLPGTYLVGLPVLQYQPRGTQPQRLQPALQNAYVKSVKLGSEDGINGKLHLDAPPREPMEIVIGLNAATLDGHVTSTTGQDLNSVTVVLIPDTRNRPETFKSTTTEKDGRFLFERIPPGNYKIFAWEFVENNAWRVPEFLATDEQHGTPVQFVEGAHRTVDVPIIPVQ